mmetsp:Transcript_68669/g.155597  ORF Transcript_68669/g.155597 Transcript_68669/m.155597 type:complete len:236 (+) Transcript_68669:58-765(+)
MEGRCGDTREELAREAVLRDEFLGLVLAHLDLQGVHAATLASQDFCEVGGSDAVWAGLCERRWATKVRSFHLTPRRRALLGATGRRWRDHYREHEVDGLRKTIMPEELSSLRFDFTFRMQPHQRAEFNFRFGADSRVHNHPNGLSYVWRVRNLGRQVALGPWPLADVTRRADWGWAVSNPNIVCCSIDEDADEEALMRGSAMQDHPELFQTDRAEEVMRAFWANLDEEEGDDELP